MIVVPKLDAVQATQQNIKDIFAAFEAALAFGAVGFERFGNLCIEYRSTSQALRVFLNKEYGYPSALTYVLTATAGWYYVTQSVVKHKALNASSYNGDDTNENNVFVAARYRVNVNTAALGAITQAAIAVKRISTGQWTVVSGTIRNIKSSMPVYTATATAADYLGTVGAHNRTNMPFQKPEYLVAAFGGSNDINDSTTIPVNDISEYAVAFNGNSTQFVAGEMMLEARGGIA